MAVSFGTIPNAIRKVKGGVLRVGDSRVSLDSVIYMFNEGADAAEIRNNYDTLSLAEVHTAIAYYLHNKEKVDKYLAKRESERERAWREHEAENPPAITREVLQKRKNGEALDWKK